MSDKFHGLIKSYNMLAQLQDAIEYLDKLEPQSELSLEVAKVLADDIYDCLESFRIENNY